MNITELNQTDTLKFTEDTEFFNNDNIETVETDLNLLEDGFPEVLEEKATPQGIRSSGYSKTSSDDTVGAFFKEMARYPLLKPAEEVELAKCVQFLVEMDQLQKRL